MKKISLIVIIVLCGLSASSQIRTLFGFSTDFNPMWISSNLSKFSIRSYFVNPQTNRYDSSTIENKIYRSNGKIDSILTGSHIVFSNDTFHLDTFLINGKTIGVHYTDSLVYIDYSKENNQFKPTYRLTITYENQKIKNYYQEYYQMTGWDGQMNKYVYKYDLSGKYMGADKYSKSITGPFLINKTINRTYNGNVIVSDSVSFSQTIDVGIYTYLNTKLLKLTSFRNSVPIEGYGLIEFDDLSKATSYMLFRVSDTIKVFFDNNGTSVKITEIETSKIDLQVYPNPTNGELNIISNIPIEKTEIYNLTGEIQSAVLNKNSINVSALNTGIYFIKVYSENGISIQKFIKQ